ncbi:hypothetical protein MMC25_005604 [Agyrium rufum]|nr:hypothetical protein [Agyrium rufum]
MPPGRPRGRPSTRNTTRSAQPTLAFNSQPNKITKPTSTLAHRSAKAERLEKDEPDGVLEEVSAPKDETVVTNEVAEKKTLESKQEQKPSTEKSIVAIHDEWETRAAKITEPQIRQYWKDREDERLAPRVHQQGLTIHDKILRYFDMSNQYGPSIGIDRSKRWKRANKLGMKPPIEILAVIVKDSAKAKDQQDVQRSIVDELMSSKYLNDE